MALGKWEYEAQIPKILSPVSLSGVIASMMCSLAEDSMKLSHLPCSVCYAQMFSVSREGSNFIKGCFVINIFML